ncbi:hypothetical protein BT69DRAFT_181903 [Atractiella rhizophila]|nr:hypothetical protein BT69DRAFT_181903 [Atractiella rhizophila]
MSSEKFNANPTVLVTASRSTPLLPSFLLDTAATADEVDECEIDEEEVFGKSFMILLLKSKP